MSPRTTPSPTTGDPRRRIAEAVLPLLAVAVALVAPLAVWGRLPDPVASHWGPSGVPDGALPRSADLAVLLLVTAALALGPLAAVRGPMPRWSARLLVATANGGATLLGVLRVVTVRANVDAPSWEAAGALTWPTVLLAVAAALAAAGLGAALAGDRPEPGPTVHRAAPAPLPAGRATVWSGTTTGRAPLTASTVLALAAAVAALAAPVGARAWTLAALSVAALAMAALGQARVTVGPAGVTVALGWLGWPRLHVPLAAVTDVRVEHVAPAAYGGWGLRRVPGATAVVIRRGEGLRIERDHGRALVVTIDGAEDAAGVLLAYRQRTDAGKG